MRTRIWFSFGCGTRTSSIASGLPSSRTTAAFIVLTIDFLLWLRVLAQRKQIAQEHGFASSEPGVLHARNASVLHSHPVADAQIDVSGVFDDQRGTGIEPHRDPVARALDALLLDFVAHDRAADGAGDRRRGIAPAAADLVTDDAARDATKHRPDIDGLIVVGAID